MPRKIPPHIKQAARTLFEGHGLQPDGVVVEIEQRFGKDGKLRADPNVPGYEVSERTIQRWIISDGWADVDVSNFPLGVIPSRDTMVSNIKDAVLHYSITVAQEMVPVRDYPGRNIRDTVRDVLEDVVLRARPRSRGVIKFLAERYLPTYIRTYRKTPWKSNLEITEEEKSMITGVMEEVKFED
jgi:hypothetical protein